MARQLLRLDQLSAPLKGKKGIALVGEHAAVPLAQLPPNGAGHLTVDHRIPLGNVEVEPVGMIQGCGGI